MLINIFGNFLNYEEVVYIENHPSTEWTDESTGESGMTDPWSKVIFKNGMSIAIDGHDAEEVYDEIQHKMNIDVWGPY